MNAELATITLLPLLLLLASPDAHAQANDPVLTFSCDGTLTNARASEEREPVNKMGLVVNLGERTVSGFAGIVAQIAKVDAAGISFGGSGDLSLPGLMSGPV